MLKTLEQLEQPKMLNRELALENCSNGALKTLEQYLEHWNSVGTALEQIIKLKLYMLGTALEQIIKLKLGTLRLAVPTVPMQNIRDPRVLKKWRK
jgi:hypothetical protein